MSGLHYTPGPWTVFTTEDEWGCDTFVGTMTDTLFDVRPWKGPAWQEGNARLAAAAPDLYAALMALRDDKVIQAVCPSPLWGAMVDALTKASGEAE